MAKKSSIIKTRRMEKEYLAALSAGKKPHFPTRIYHRCRLCGRNRAYMTKFDMCRICFRECARRGQIPGIKKSSW